MNHSSFMSVSWDSPLPGEKERSYREQQIEDLRTQARALRHDDETPVGPVVELLRTIGQELDDAEVELSAVIRDAQAFQVSGVSAGRHYRTTYRTKDLVAIAAGRRARRGQAPLATGPSSAQGDSFVGVEVGAQVFTEDKELLGRVTEIRGRYFRVGKDFLGEEYWLPAESVASVGPSGEVKLWPLEN
jgi:hypothetical protein